MCGIAGFLRPSRDGEFGGDGRSDSEALVKSMLHAIRHRGPDGSGIHQGENHVFGHQRLAIIDVDGGAQPMSSEDGRFVIVFNGEIYNYLELRQELSQVGEKFETFSDTEVLLRLFMREGIQCLSKLNGMFAFAILDRKQKKFWAVRDRVGIKPFYYYRTKKNELIFASEIKALFCHKEIKAEVNSHGLHQYLTYQFCIGDQTLFSGIKKLEPGMGIEWDFNEGSPKLFTYWDLRYTSPEVKSEEFYQEKILSILEDSVRLQLRSDVPVGTYLSGGLDSSIISLLSADNMNQQLSVFSGRFSEGPAYDESEYARAIAEQIDAKYFDIVPTAQQFVDSLPNLIYHMDEPVAGPGLFPQFIVSQEASKHVKVILGGQGGDEVFGGYIRYMIASFELALKNQIFNTKSSDGVTIASMIPYLSALESYVPLLKSFMKEGLFEPEERRYFRLVDRSHDIKTLLSGDVAAGHSAEEVFSEFSRIFRAPDTDSYFNRMTYFDLKTLVPALLQVEDRVSMAVSLESRVPLLDHRIIEFMATIPANIKFKGGQPKFLLKQAFKNQVPAKIFNRKDKMGFPVPLSEWLKQGVVKDFVNDILRSKQSMERGLFDRGALDKLICSESQFGRQLWGVLCLELWHQKFIDHR